MSRQFLFHAVLLSVVLIFSTGCELTGGDSGGSSGFDSSIVATWLETDSAFYNYINYDGMDIESNGDVYDVDCWLDGYYYYQVTGYLIAHLDTASGGAFTGYNYEESAPMSGTYSLGSSSGFTTLTIHVTSPENFYQYFIKAE